MRNLQEFERIYINPDLTEAQRRHERDLRSQRRERNEEERINNQPFRWEIRGYGLRRFCVDSEQQASDQQQDKISA